MRNSKYPHTLFKPQQTVDFLERRMTVVPKLHHAITVNKELTSENTKLIIGCGHDFKHSKIKHSPDEFYTMGLESESKPDLLANFWHEETQEYLKHNKFTFVSFEATPWIEYHPEKMITNTFALLADKSAFVISGVNVPLGGEISNALLQRYNSYKVFTFQKDPILLPDLKNCTIIASTEEIEKDSVLASYIQSVIQEKIHNQEYIDFIKRKGFTPKITEDNIQKPSFGTP